MVVVGLGAQQFILNNYHSIELSLYEKTIPNLMQSIKTQQGFVRSAAGDYSEWDDTYSFIAGENPEFINTNFRDETSALQTLGVDFIILTHFDKTAVFSAFQKKSSDNIELQKEILSKKLPDKSAKSSFLSFKDTVYIFHRHLITNSDKSVLPNGYLYMAKRLDISFLKNSHLEFTDIQFEFLKDVVTPQNLLTMESLKYTYKTIFLSDTIKTNIDVFDANKDYVWTITTSYPRDIVLQGESTTRLFLFIVGMMAAIIFFLFWQRQKSLINEKMRSEKLVEERTKQLKETMHELHVAITDLKTIAYIDSLTGVSTRRGFFEQIALILEASEKNHQQVSCAMMDLDDFKNINDKHGHDTGDFVLKHFCQACEHFLDDKMLLARLGGEEFVISFKNYSIEQAMEVCQKIQQYIAQNPVIINKKTKIYYTVSIGIADNMYTSNIDQILKEADEKLYSSKAEGKNMIRIRNPKNS